MLGGLEKQQGICAAAVDMCADLHANARLGADQSAHHPWPLGEIDKHDIIGFAGQPRPYGGDRVDGADSTRLHPGPVTVAGAGFGDARREKMTTTGARALQAKFTLAECLPPCLFDTHRRALWPAA